MTTAKQAPVSLGDWQVMVWGIYREKDLRDYPPAEMILSLIGTYRAIAKGSRKENAVEILEALPKMFIWLLSSCSMLGLDLERIVWAKYPGLCPYCEATQHCSCLTQKEKPQDLYRNDNGTLPFSLDAWQAMFERIYGRVNRIVARNAIVSHLGEELAEVSTAFKFRGSREGMQELEHELADVFAWIMALAIRYDVMLSTLAFATYPGVCDTCKSAKCACPKV